MRTNRHWRRIMFGLLLTAAWEASAAEPTKTVDQLYAESAKDWEKWGMPAQDYLKLIRIEEQAKALAECSVYAPWGRAGRYKLVHEARVRNINAYRPLALTRLKVIEKNLQHFAGDTAVMIAEAHQTSFEFSVAMRYGEEWQKGYQEGLEQVRMAGGGFDKAGPSLYGQRNCDSVVRAIQ